MTTENKLANHQQQASREISLKDIGIKAMAEIYLDNLSSRGIPKNLIMGIAEKIYANIHQNTGVVR